MSLRWSGHVIRMEANRIPKQLLFGELAQGQRKQGHPRKHFNDTLKDSLKWCNIKPDELVNTAQDRLQWHALTRRAFALLEEEHRNQSQVTHEQHHRAALLPARSTDFQCPACSRLCKYRIGLQSHSQTHR